jgi:hypothetical protein
LTKSPATKIWLIGSTPLILRVKASPLNNAADKDEQMLSFYSTPEYNEIESEKGENPH